MQEQIQEHIESRGNYPVDQLHKLWNETEAPYEVGLTGGKIYKYGNKGFSKMIAFAFKVDLASMDQDFWLAIPPSRKEEEPYEDYKIRMKFQAALLKYRPFIYNFPDITQKKIKAQRKAQKKVNG